jgi:hypothetical protein
LNIYTGILLFKFSFFNSPSILVFILSPFATLQLNVFLFILTFVIILFFINSCASSSFIRVSVEPESPIANTFFAGNKFIIEFLLFKFVSLLFTFIFVLNKANLFLLIIFLLLLLFLFPFAYQ